MANTLKERAANMTTEERREVFGAHNVGKPSPFKGVSMEERHGDKAGEVREKIKKSRASQVISEEHRRKIGNASRGRVKSMEELEKLRNCKKWNKGLKLGPRSEETKQKISESHKKRLT